MTDQAKLAAQVEAEMLEALAPGQAILVDWTAERYFADTQTINRSALEDLRAEGPRYFEGRHITREIEGRSSDAMSFGSLAHTCTLEPEEWRRRQFEPEPERPANANGRAKKDTPEKQAYNTWKRDVDEWSLDLAKIPNAIILADEERVVFDRIAERVRGHELLAPAFEGPEAMLEQTAIWREPETGVLIRVRYDLLAPIYGDTVVAFDLKTTHSPQPSAFARSAAKYGYHRQAALYGDVAQALYPEADIAFVIAAVRNKPPHEVVVYETPEDAIDLGRAQYRRALATYVEHRDRDEWTADYETELQILTLPSWAFYEE